MEIEYSPLTRFFSKVTLSKDEATLAVFLKTHPHAIYCANYPVMFEPVDSITMGRVKSLLLEWCKQWAEGKKMPDFKALWEDHSISIQQFHEKIANCMAESNP